MPTPQPPPSLLTLPPDLRLRIYTHLLVSPTPLKGPSARLHSTKPNNTIHTAILRVNKQLHTEARHIFFGMNTFCINPAPLAHHGKTCPSDDDEEEDGSGAFEPPLQLKDLCLVRSLDIDLVYWSLNARAAERYVTSLSFLLNGAKESLAELRIGGDGRGQQHMSSSSSSSSALDVGDGDGQGRSTLDVKRFLAGFRAASESWRFQDALAALNVASVGVRFEFEEMWFDFSVERDVLLKNDLAHLAGQVLVAKTEIGIRETLEELDRVEGEEMEG